MDQDTPTLDNGVIRFPEAKDKKAAIALIKAESCGPCSLGIECTGPFVNGGDVRAEFHSGRINDQGILAGASCLHKKES